MTWAPHKTVRQCAAVAKMTVQKYANILTMLCKKGGYVQQLLHERSGEAFEFDAKLTVIGKKLQVGDTAPDFALEYLAPTENAIKLVKLSDSAGKVRVLNVINSLDTPVCHAETHRWESMRTEWPEEVVLYTISMDLPFAQQRWHNAEHVNHASLSGHLSEQFGQDYGVLIKEWRLLQRAVFVIGKDERILYAEYVADQMQEPNYNAALDAVKRGLAS